MKDMRKALHDILGEDLLPGEVLRGLRVRLGLSQEQLAEITGIARPNISALENNRLDMTSHYAEMFAVIFNVHPSEILYPNGHVKKSPEILKLEKKAQAYLKKVSSYTNYVK